MDSRYLKSLLAVVECGSIADAARAEGLTAAAIGQRIQALERELDFALLARGGHTAKPTDACLALLPRARHIVREVSLLAGDADPHGLTGTLRIGVISTALTGLLPAALHTLTRQVPGVKPIVVPGASRVLYQALLAKELDAAILVAPPFALPRLVRAVALRQEALVFLSNKKWRDDIGTALRNRPYIRYDPESWGGRHAARYLDDQRIAPNVLCDLDALEAIAMLVADGVGVSLVPRWSGLERLAANCRVAALPGTPYQREIVLLSNAQSERPKLVLALTQALQQSVGT
ncbi:MAG: LysR substrate-binding domain-containing protein [Janthinobacterium lividum]